MRTCQKMQGLADSKSQWCQSSLTIIGSGSSFLVPCQKKRIAVTESRISAPTKSQRTSRTIQKHSRVTVWIGMPFEMEMLQSVALGEFGLDGDFHLDALSIHISNLHSDI